MTGVSAKNCIAPAVLLKEYAVLDANLQIATLVVAEVDWEIWARVFDSNTSGSSIATCVRK